MEEERIEGGSVIGGERGEERRGVLISWLLCIESNLLYGIQSQLFLPHHFCGLNGSSMCIFPSISGTQRM